MNKKIFGFLLLSLLIIPVFALAQTTTSTNACSNATANASVAACVSQVYIWSLGIAAVLALLMIVLGGYITLTAAGNAERATRGKSYITSSIVGLVLLFGAYILLRTINPDLVNFNNSCVANLNNCFNNSATPTPTPIPPPPQ